MPVAQTPAHTQTERQSAGGALDDEFLSRPKWWDEVEQDELAPQHALGYGDLIRRHSRLRERAGDTVWSIQGRGGSHNWLRLGLATLAAAVWALAGTLHGATSPAAIGAAAACIIALANLIVMMLMWLKVVALADWLRRLAAGDLEYRMQFRHQSTLRHLCTALDTLREQSRRVIELRVVDRLGAELHRRNDALAQAVEDLARTQGQIVARQKRAEVGGLAAGIGAEIHRPIEASRALAERARAALREARGIIDAANEGPGETGYEETARQIEESLKQIAKHAERADEIVQAMRDLGREDGHRTAIDLNRTVAEQTRRALGFGAKTEPLTLEEDYDQTVGTVRAERAGVARLVRSLVSNARQAVHERAATEGDGYRGRLRITTRREGAHIAIGVDDNGTGMSRETLARATAPFFTTRAPNEGVGLGLSQAESVAQGHGGALAIESTQGEGTRVTARLARGEGK